MFLSHNHHVDRIELNPSICNGKPVIRGTRIGVSTILGFLDAGDAIDDILVGYPQLTRADVAACLDYARRLSETHSVFQMTS